VPTIAIEDVSGLIGTDPSGARVDRQEDAATVDALFIVAGVFFADAVLRKETTQATGKRAYTGTDRGRLRYRTRCNGACSSKWANPWNGECGDAEQSADGTTADRTFKCTFALFFDFMGLRVAVVAAVFLTASDHRKGAIGHAGITKFASCGLGFGVIVEDSRNEIVVHALLSMGGNAPPPRVKTAIGKGRSSTQPSSAN